MGPMPRQILVLIAVLSFVCAAVSAQQRGRGTPQGDDAPAARGVAPVTLPEGAGKDIVQKACSECHALNSLTPGHDAAEWKLTMDRMMTAGAQVPANQVAAVTDYLIKNFPPRDVHPAVVIPGSARVAIREWDVPTRGSRPHDPLAASDGSLWWTGQYANVLGRLDVKTGMMKEFPLPGRSGPHGLTEDRQGNIWYTANAGAYVGRLNPKTGEVTQYKMPDPAARDPHTPLFDQKGMLWFTLQNSNMIGRLNPQTGEVKLVTAPTPRSLPYGMVVSSKGVPFLVFFGTNKIGSLDPDTMTITEYTLPNAATRPRRIAITDDDVIWYADYSRGYLGKFDPKTGQMKEWASPGGRDSQPYGITAVKDIVWYSESNTKPNTLVRFDPKTEKFQTWTIPSGGGVVRNMMATRDGDLVMACSAKNKVAFVDVSS